MTPAKKTTRTTTKPVVRTRSTTKKKVSTTPKPKPKVTSAVLKLIPYEKPKINISDINKFSDFVGKSFISRRKTILNNIASGHKISKNEAVEILNKEALHLATQLAEIAAASRATAAVAVAR